MEEEFIELRLGRFFEKWYVNATGKFFISNVIHKEKKKKITISIPNYIILKLTVFKKKIDLK